MFFKDFIPNNLDDFIINGEIAKKIKPNKGILNTIIYGPNGVGKLTLARSLVKNSANVDKINIRGRVVNDNSINISSYHYELFVSQYNYKDKTSFVKTLDEFTDSLNVSTGCNNIIIIKNADLLSRENILTIKKYTERSDKFVTFIMTMKKMGKYRAHLNSFMTIRVPSTVKEDIIDFIKIKIHEQGLTGISEPEIEKIIDTNKSNLKGIFLDLETVYLGNQVTLDKTVKIKNERGKFVKKIVNSIFQFNYTDVREYLYELTTKNIEKVDILKLVVNKIISCDLTEAQRFRIVELAGEYSAKMAICNKEVIQLEAFCFECMALFVIK